jgi:hypothetical protein
MSKQARNVHRLQNDLELHYEHHLHPRDVLGRKTLDDFIYCSVSVLPTPIPCGRLSKQQQQQQRGCFNIIN